MFSYGSRNQSSSLPSLRIHSIGQVNVNYFDEDPGGIVRAPFDMQDDAREEQVLRGPLTRQTRIGAFERVQTGNGNLFIVPNGAEIDPDYNFINLATG